MTIQQVSVLFNEPKLLKYQKALGRVCPRPRFSALQRAEIAEIRTLISDLLQTTSFSALQRAEIAEITSTNSKTGTPATVSVLFNEPKLLKWRSAPAPPVRRNVSVLFNEPKLLKSLLLSV